MNKEINEIICSFKGHKRGKTKLIQDHYWAIECERCGYGISYYSPSCRLIGLETKFGFDGE